MVNTCRFFRSQSLLRQVCIRPYYEEKEIVVWSLNPFFVRSVFVPSIWTDRGCGDVSIPSSSGLYSSQNFLSITEKESMSQSLLRQVCIRPQVWYVFIQTLIVSIPSSSGLYSSVVGILVGGCLKVSIPSSSGLHSSLPLETTARLMLSLNPFFVRSAFVRCAGIDPAEFLGLNPFFVRSAFVPPEAATVFTRWSLNPFFVRSAFVRCQRLAHLVKVCLNPFFVRSAFVPLQGAVPYGTRRLNPFFVRAAFVLMERMCGKLDGCLNPFFVRSAFVQIVKHRLFTV